MLRAVPPLPGASRGAVSRSELPARTTRRTAPPPRDSAGGFGRGWAGQGWGGGRGKAGPYSRSQPRSAPDKYQRLFGEQSSYLRLVTC